MIAFVSIKWNI